MAHHEFLRIYMENIDKEIKEEPQSDIVEELLEYFKDAKPMDPEFEKILSDNILDLF